MKRSKWKGPFVNKRSENTKVQRFLRSSEITPRDIGLQVSVHTGKTFVIVELTNEMTGHKIGEFAPTKGRTEHPKKK